MQGLGDSLASGEGNPDTPKGFFKAAVWKDPPNRCDRSGNSFEAQVVQRLQKAYPDTPVTCVHLACSGASIPRGLTGPYEGIHPAKPDLPAQIAAAQTRLGGHKPDAVLLSAGVNDLQFGAVVTFCVGPGSGDCMGKPYPK